MRVLLVEDDVKMAQMLSRGLGEEGFAVEVVGDGRSGLERLRTGAHDACILDVLLPGLDGFTVLERARQAGVTTPLILLTARDAIADRVRGLNLGADDYLVKPFAFAELLARLQAISRRAARPPTADTRLRAGALELDAGAHRAWCRGAELELSQKQFALLETFLRHAGQVLTRAALLERVWGYHFDPGTNLIDVHVGHLRAKLDRDGEPSLIETVRGVGFRLNDHAPS